MSTPLTEPTTSTSTNRWQHLADRVLAGEKLTPAEATEVLQAPDSELLDLMHAAYRVRQH